MRACVATAVLLLACSGARAQTAPVRPDLPALIECRQRIGDFNALAPVLADPLKAVALGWTPLEQANLFMTSTRSTRRSACSATAPPISRFPAPASWRCWTCPTRARWPSS